MGLIEVRAADDPQLAAALATSSVPLVELMAAGGLGEFLADIGMEFPAEDAAVLDAFEVSRASLGIDTVAVFVRPLDDSYGQGCD